MSPVNAKVARVASAKALPRPSARAPHPPAAGFGHRPPLPGVKAVGSFVPGLTGKAFERYGFLAATLVTDWAAIVGRELAAATTPERLKWPRPAQKHGGADEPPAKGRPGAVLLLRVDGGRSLDVQFAARQIIERINAYFGYAAVAELRLLQAPLALPTAAPAAPPPLTPRQGALATQELAGISDRALRAALSRLGAGVRGKSA
jgi:hypothetical protein